LLELLNAKRILIDQFESIKLVSSQ